MKLQLSLLHKRYSCLEELFDDHDNDGSHTSDCREFQDMLADLSITCKCSIDFDELWASIDIDGDGEIMKDEWCRVLQDYYLKSGEILPLPAQNVKFPQSTMEMSLEGLLV